MADSDVARGNALIMTFNAAFLGTLIARIKKIETPSNYCALTQGGTLTIYAEILDCGIDSVVQTTIGDITIYADEVIHNGTGFAFKTSLGGKLVAHVNKYTQAIKEIRIKIDSIFLWFSGNKLKILSDVCVDDICITKDQFKALLLREAETAHIQHSIEQILIPTNILSTVSITTQIVDLTDTTTLKSISSSTPEIIPVP